MSHDGTQSRRTVAVTGSTGFLGRAFVAALLARGDRVVALVRPASDVSRLPAHGHLELVTYAALGDAALLESLRALTPNAFVHLGWAGVAGPARGDVDHVATNVPATIASVRLAAAAGCGYWLGTGSQAEYGPSELEHVEDASLRPVTDYGVAKVAAAAAAHAIGDSLGIATGWARVFSLYGPDDHDGAVLPYAIRTLLAGEAPQLGPCLHDWDLLHVEDAAEAFASLVQFAAPGAYNVAAGTRRPLRDAIELAADTVAGTARPAYAATAAASIPLRTTIVRIAAATGWTPRIPLEVGVPQVVEHLRQSSGLLPIGAST